MNVAVTATLAVKVTTHVDAVPEQPPPDQPPNRDPELGFSVSVTTLFWSNVAVQVVPQLIPAGELVTDPAPEPPFATANVSCWLKLAWTVVSAVSVTVQVGASPVQPPPDQPANRDPVAAAAVRTTCVPEGNAAEHVEPQSIPAGELVTDPDPVPPGATVRVGSGSAAAPAAETRHRHAAIAATSNARVSTRDLAIEIMPLRWGA
jgi:hypothetical protein